MARRAAGTATRGRARLCDDGNAFSAATAAPSTCQIEAGFKLLDRRQRTASVDCPRGGNNGKCLELPIKYRDYKNESVTGGHPDFFYLGASVANPAVSITGVDGQTGAVNLFNKRYCVSELCRPGEEERLGELVAWDLAAGDPRLRTANRQFNTARIGIFGVATLRDCQFIDWDSPDTNGGHVPGYTLDHRQPDQWAGAISTQGRQRPPDVPRAVRRSSAARPQSFGDGSATPPRGGGPTTRTTGNSHTIG